MLLGMSAVSWVVAVAMFGAWPLAGLLAWLVVRWWRRHDQELGGSGH